MRAKFVNENIRFERGQDPKDALQIGDWSIKSALLNSEESLDNHWWLDGGLPAEFLADMGYDDTNPNSHKDYLGFDEDYYLEQEAPDWVNYDIFHTDFYPLEPMKQRPNTNGWGTFTWRKGDLPDGTIVYHYQDGMSSGYIARKEWLKE